jgi:hypothetical protein
MTMDDNILPFISSLQVINIAENHRNCTAQIGTPTTCVPMVLLLNLDSSFSWLFLVFTGTKIKNLN